MGNFVEDEVIPTSQLIPIMVAEGFLKPINGKCLEEAASILENLLIEISL